MQCYMLSVYQLPFNSKDKLRKQAKQNYKHIHLTYQICGHNALSAKCGKMVNLKML
jgi:hypothetical protein